MDSIIVNSQEVACSSGCQAIINTGTFVMAGPPSDISNIQRAVGARQDMYGEHNVNCSSIPAMLDIVSIIDGLQWSVSAPAYTEQPMQHNPGSCMSSFQNTSRDLWILGDVFLRVYYSIFDKANHRVGLAKAV